MIGSVSNALFTILPSAGDTNEIMNRLADELEEHAKKGTNTSQVLLQVDDLLLD